MLWPKVLTADAEQRLKKGDRFKECADCPEMVVVPAGEFMMGSPDAENGRSGNETPRHKVTIARAFAVSRFEVTFEEWDACLNLGGCDFQPSDQGFGRDKRPVINVSWNDAQKYVAWLAKRTGKIYRLLSESEWEYAARAGSDKAYSWSDDIGKGNAKCNGCDNQEDLKRTVPVGSFPANPFGLYDMHGNVYEWVQDCVHRNYQGAPDNGSAWLMEGDCSLRIVRGGSWDSSPASLRSALRNRYSSGARVTILGFRVARTLTLERRDCWNAP